MTFEEYFVDRLYNNGLFKDQAQGVVDLMKEDKGNESMSGRWDDDISGYPESMTTILWVSARRNAVKWIDQHAPQHWARGVFE